MNAQPLQSSQIVWPVKRKMHRWWIASCLSMSLWRLSLVGWMHTIQVLLHRIEWIRLWNCDMSSIITMTATNNSKTNKYESNTLENAIGLASWVRLKQHKWQHMCASVFPVQVPRECFDKRFYYYVSVCAMVVILWLGYLLCLLRLWGNW